MALHHFDESELASTLQECSIPFVVKGNRYQLYACPHCEQGRKDKSDHCSFDRFTGQYNCLKCGEKGNLITFRRFLGLDPFPSKSYKKPPEMVKEYQKQPEAYFQSYEEARGIPTEILKKYGIGKHMHFDIGLSRTYPFIDELGELVNVKYINKQKDMRQEKDTRKIYFGLQFVDFTKKYLHVTEGEDDCMAMAAMGIDNVVSLPSGANSYVDDMGRINKQFEKIYLVFDSDKAGEDGARGFAQKAGIYKCWRVDLPFKDARECIKNGLDIFDIEKFKVKARQYEYGPCDKCRPALSSRERIERFEKECAINREGIVFGFPMIDMITGGLRSDVFGIIANPGCFKTTMLMNLLLRANIKNGIALFFSLEMGIESEYERELQIGTSRRPKELRQLAGEKSDEWKAIRNEMIEKHEGLYVSEESFSSVDEIIDITRKTEAVTGKNCVIIGIDYLDFVKASATKEYDAVREVMNDFKSKIARAMKIPVITLIQTNRSTKDSETEVTLRDGKGGTGIESACDFAIGLWMDGDEVVGRFNKHRRIDTLSYYPYPYFRIGIDKANYKITDLELMENPAKKKKEKKQKKELQYAFKD